MSQVWFKSVRSVRCCCPCLWEEKEEKHEKQQAATCATIKTTRLKHVQKCGACVWAVVRGPSGTKRAAESGKACGITATATSDGETLIWRGRLATPQNPSLALTRLPAHGWGKPPWRDAKGWHLDQVRYSLMPPSPPHSFHPYAVLTAFVAALLHKISIVTPVMCNGCS